MVDLYGNKTISTKSDIWVSLDLSKAPTIYTGINVHNNLENVP